MSWLVSILVALFTGATAMVLSGILGNACVNWYRISSREGASGNFVIGIALVGAVAGCLLGLIVARVIAWTLGPSFLKECTAAILVVCLATAIATWLARSFADIPPTLDGCELQLQVEFRFPDTMQSEQSPTSEGEWLFTFGSLSGVKMRASEQGEVRSELARREAGRWVVPTEVSLFTERGKRCVSLSKRESTEVMSFLLPIPSRPGSEFEQWSEWLPRQQSDGSPWPSDRMSCRYRIQKIPKSTTQQ